MHKKFISNRLVMAPKRKHYVFVPFPLVYSLLIFSFHGVSSFADDTLTANESLRDGQTLISPLQTFELGFFTPGNSQNRYLGIWYRKSRDTVVWVANRDNPITDHYGVLTVSSNGNLVLLNRTDKIIWSSNTSRQLENPMVELLDSGNLVVRDNNSSSAAESYLWQSFDHPSDTLLPWMKLGWNLKSGKETYLTSWRSIDDPSPGDYTLKLDLHDLPQLVIATRSKKKYRTSPWNGMASPITGFWNNSVYTSTIVQNEDEVYFIHKPYSKSVITRLQLDQLGYMRRFAINDWNEGWKVMHSLPMDTCDNYGECGANAICRPTSQPYCGCLKGFTTKSEMEEDTEDWSGDTKCKRKPVPDCQRGEGFLKLENTKPPDLLYYRFNENLNLDQCGDVCLKNCSCRAFANMNISGTGKGCLMWFGDLLDVSEREKQYSRNFYLRVPASEFKSIQHSNEKRTVIVVSIATAFGAFIFLGLAFFISRKKLNRKGMDNENLDMEVPFFDMQTIANATNNFSHSNVVGEGGFGRVYKGELPNGQQIAVKRLSKNSRQGAEEFRNEVVIIAKLQHKNLVALIGSCMQGEERMLIYEYLPNKSLDCYIFDHKSSTIAWKRRFDIILGIARGLLYLHQDSKLQIIHRDLKASNILLDRQMTPKISDFGLARIFRSDDEKEEKTMRVMGTFGYMSPEYAIDGKFSIKSDIFSFGVLLLEIISGKRNRGFYHPDHHHNLLGHAWLLWIKDRALELMDATLEETCMKSQVLRCIQMGLLCVQNLSEDRPTMSFIVSILGNEEAVLPQPKQPGFFTERSRDGHSISIDEQPSSKNSISLSILEAR